MTQTYCPKRDGRECERCGNRSYGTPQRLTRFAIAVATLAALGGVTDTQYRCPVTGAWLTIGVDPVEVDRPSGKSGCYTKGNVIITSRNGNQSRNAGEDAAWTVAYTAAVRDAGATVGHITQGEAEATWKKWHPVAHSSHVATGATWWAA